MSATGGPTSQGSLFRRNWPLWGAILCLLLVAIAVGWVGGDWLPSTGPVYEYAGLGTPIIAFSLGTPHVTNGSGGVVATYPVTVAASGLIAVDLQLCYLGADNLPVHQSYTAQIVGTSGGVVATYDSEVAHACISPSTGLNSSMLYVGGWILGSHSQVVVGDNLTIQRPAFATQLDVSNWGPGQDGSSMVGYPV